MAVQTTLNLPDAIKVYYDKLLLDRLKASLWFAQFADKRPLPRNTGKTIEFTRYQNLPVSKTPLTEGVVQTSGDSENLTVSKKSVNVLQFGDHIQYSDLFVATKIDPALEEQIDIVAYQAAESIDEIMQDALATQSGSTIFGDAAPCSTEKFAAGAANRDALIATNILNGQEVREARTDLKKADVKPFSGSDFVMLIHPVSESDMLGDTSLSGFVEGHKYDQPENLYMGELGKWSGVRFVTSSKLHSETNAGSVDTYDSYLLGQHAYAMTELAGESMKLHISAPKESIADPLAQVGTIGWKATFAAACLNPDRVIKLVTGSAIAP